MADGHGAGALCPNRTMNHVVIGSVFTGRQLRAHVYFTGTKAKCLTYISNHSWNNVSVIRDTERARKAYCRRNQLEPVLCVS